jgi:hypothetical protein
VRPRASALDQAFANGTTVEAIIGNQLSSGGEYLVSSTNNLGEAYGYATRFNPENPVVHALDLDVNTNPASLNGSTAAELSGTTVVTNRVGIPEEFGLPITEAIETGTFPEQVLGYVSCKK